MIAIIVIHRRQQIRNKHSQKVGKLTVNNSLVRIESELMFRDGFISLIYGISYIRQLFFPRQKNF